MKAPFVCLLILAVFPVSSRSQDLPLPNAPAILKELDQIASGAKNQFAARRNAALLQIQSAASSGSSAVDFYIQALQNTKYKENHQDLVDWRRKNEELLRSVAFQNAAQLQLRYLILTLQRSDQHDAYSQIPECMDYLTTLSSAISLNSARSGDTATSNSGSQKITKTSSSDKPYSEAVVLIQQSLNGSAVVQWLQIEDLLPDGKDCCFSPGDYQQIMEKNIRIPMRAKNDPRLPGTWDLQIAFEAAKATATGSQQHADEFNQNRLQELLLSKAKDTVSIGQPNRALAEVMDLIHRYPANPDIKDWIDFARQLLGKATTATPIPTTTPTAINAPAPAQASGRATP